MPGAGGVWSTRRPVPHLPTPLLHVHVRPGRSVAETPDGPHDGVVQHGVPSGRKCPSSGSSTSTAPARAGAPAARGTCGSNLGRSARMRGWERTSAASSRITGSRGDSRRTARAGNHLAHVEPAKGVAIVTSPTTRESTSGSAKADLAMSAPLECATRTTRSRSSSSSRSRTSRADPSRSAEFVPSAGTVWTGWPASCRASPSSRSTGQVSRTPGTSTTGVAVPLSQRAGSGAAVNARSWAATIHA